MLKKLLSIGILLCFTLSTSVEARKHVRRSSIASHTVKKAKAKKNRKAVATRKKVARASKHKKHVHIPNKKTQKRAAVERKRTQTRIVKHKRVQKSSRTTQRQTPSANVLPQVPISTPAPLLAPPPPPTYLSQLKSYTQRNAQLSGLDKLYLRNFQGQGQTVAVIEQSGTYKKLRNWIDNSQDTTSSEIRKNYKNNFLSAIGGPALHPEEQNDWIRIVDQNTDHGASVSSVVLDLSPQAKVLPVSTYNTPGVEETYDVADALMALSQRTDVNIINISAGYIDFKSDSKWESDINGNLLNYISKTIYTPKLVEAFRAVARSGKVVVLAAGNNGANIQPPQYCKDSGEPRSQIMGHLIEALDPETRESIIIAGALDPDTNAHNDYSNKPGAWKEAQTRFIFASGRYMPPYQDYTVGGTSFAAPQVCAAIANLCAKPGVTPKMAMKALLDSADERPDKAIYGRGVMRADKALELLENVN